MVIAQLSKFIKPLNNQFESIMKFQHWIVSRNLCIHSASKRLSVIKSPENNSTRKRIPKLSLKVNPQSKKLYLQISDKESQSTSSEYDSKFCTFCNAPRCKIIYPPSDNDNNNNQLARNDKNRVTISVDRDALCETICNGIADGENETRKVEDTREYCGICKAPKCKFDLKNIENGGDEGEKCKLDAIDGPKSNEKGEEDLSEYCDECKAPKCKLIKNTTGDVDVRSQDLSNDDQYCKYCEAPKCKITANSKTSSNVDKSSIKDDSSSSKKRNRNLNKRSVGSDEGHKRSTENTTDITKSSEYCPECKLPQCKYSTSNKHGGAALQPLNSGEISEASKISNQITITVDRKDICGVICTGGETSRNALASTPQYNNETETSVSKKDKTPKNKRFYSSYNEDNSKN